MRYALVSDVHANLPALEAVLADISSREDVEGTYHLGDLVSYAPWPNEVVARLRAEDVAGIAGNYDSTVGLRLAGLKAGDAIAFGHTHEPWHRTVEGIHFVNTGSVGRPNDGD
jgi:predicted phosphodiesterase